MHTLAPEHPPANLGIYLDIVQKESLQLILHRSLLRLPFALPSTKLVPLLLHRALQLLTLQPARGSFREISLSHSDRLRDAAGAGSAVV